MNCFIHFTVIFSLLSCLCAQVIYEKGKDLFISPKTILFLSTNQKLYNLKTTQW